MTAGMSACSKKKAKCKTFNNTANFWRVYFKMIFLLSKEGLSIQGISISDTRHKLYHIFKQKVHIAWTPPLVNVRQLWVFRRDYNQSSSADRGRCMAQNIKLLLVPEQVVLCGCSDAYKKIWQDYWLKEYEKKWLGAKPIIANHNIKRSWQS